MSDAIEVGLWPFPYPIGESIIETLWMLLTIRNIWFLLSKVPYCVVLLLRTFCILRLASDSIVLHFVSIGFHRAYWIGNELHRLKTVVVQIEDADGKVLENLQFLKLLLNDIFRLWKFINIFPDLCSIFHPSNAICPFVI